MSSYYDIAINPKTGSMEKAMWVDDAYGSHLYGVQFADGKMYPVTEITQINSTELFDEVLRLRNRLEHSEEAMRGYKKMCEIQAGAQPND